MKKLVVIVLSLVLLVTLGVYASAAADLTDVEKAGFTPYPLFDAEGSFTEGVTFYLSDGTEVAEDTLKACIGQAWDANTIKDGSGAYQFIVWSNAGHMAFDNGVRLCGTSTIEIVFTGTGIRLGTCYRHNDGSLYDCEAKIVVDGEEVKTDADLLHTDWADDTTPTIFYEVEGLENKTHTIKISPAKGEFEFSWYEINGTLGVTEVSTTETTEVPTTTAPEEPTTTAPELSEEVTATVAPATSNYVVPIVIVAIASMAGIVVATKKKH